MQLLLFIAVCAGVAYGEYSACNTQAPIVTECSQKYLNGYLKTLNSNAFTDMGDLSGLDDISYLIINVELVDVCNNTVKLNMYYTCVFTNLTKCLGNSSQTELVPDPTTIAKGIVDVCHNLADLNTTCMKNNMDAATACIAKGTKTSPCETYKSDYMCMDKLDKCQGVDIMRNFVESARPNTCSEISAATQILTTISLLLVAALSSILINL